MEVVVKVNMQNIKKLSLLLFIMYLILFIGGCAISRKVDYRETDFNTTNITTPSIAIATWDQRPKVIDGSRKSNFVGYMRSGVGIAFPMGTKSGTPFVNEISQEILQTLKKSGIKSTIVKTSPDERYNNILNNLIQQNANKLILIKCIELHTDGYAKHALLYNLDVYIYNSTGEEIVKKNFSGKNDVTRGNYKRAMPGTLSELLEEVFNDSNIRSALNQTYNGNQIKNIEQVKKEIKAPDISGIDQKNSIGTYKDVQYDIIYMLDGTETKGLVIEITEKVIKYKKIEQLDGPIRNVNVDDIFMIIYKDGTREIFKGRSD
jgi:hypothetical protein